jgi:hypothetical protein
LSKKESVKQNHSQALSAYLRLKHILKTVDCDVELAETFALVRCEIRYKERDPKGSNANSEIKRGVMWSRAGMHSP